jgi:hypothetical protein
MNLHFLFRLPWRSFWLLKKERTEPFWAQLAVGTALALSAGFCMILISGLITGNARDLNWWRYTVPINMSVCLCVAYGILAITRGIEKLLPAARIESISAAGDWRAALVINGIVLAGVVLGVAVSVSMTVWLYGWHLVGPFLTSDVAKTKLLAFLIAIAAANWFWWRLRARQDTLLHQATEAQLRLLQAQIEPHFLFNTLANVHSLLERDTPRARLMLETFTDYLRASLGQLRHTDSTLAAELEMVRNYLTLLQIRMEERLRFEIDASDEALAATLPTLLLQPLVENAIEHGLEPKVEGGRVHIRARIVDGRLDICVEDDGLGLDGPRRLGRPGNGMALANIRERLHARYGANAMLTLAPQTAGVRVALSIPFETPA